MTRSLLAALLTLGLAGLAHADLGVPKRPPVRPLPPAPVPVQREAKLVVEVDPAVVQPRLVIPRSLLGVAAPGGLGRPVGLLDRLPTIVAGLALTLAFVSGGLWLARRRNARLFAALLTASLLVGGSATLFADISVGPRPVRKAETLKLPASVLLTGKITVEVVERGDAIKLVVPAPKPGEVPGAPGVGRPGAGAPGLSVGDGE